MGYTKNVLLFSLLTWGLSIAWAADYRSAAELSEALANGQATSEQLVRNYRQQITEHAELNAITQLNPHALDDARQLDSLRSSGTILGPLHGVPVVLKDNIDTADGLANTAGSVLLEDNIPEQDAFFVKQLKKAGVVILGKANLSEWANFRSTGSSSGWSATGGQTLNPYDLSRSPCGSSAGSAVAVAAGLIPLAVGTETDGSVTCPAAMNGIVGIKPTVGLVSRSGIIPISIHQDTAGPMATTVEGAVLLLDAMVGTDTKDSYSTPPAAPYARYLKPGGLKGMRVGVVRNLMGYSPTTDQIFERALEQMRQNGAVVIDDANIDTLPEIEKYEFDLLIWDFKDAINQYLAQSTSPTGTCPLRSGDFHGGTAVPRPGGAGLRRITGHA